MGNWTQASLSLSGTGREISPALVHLRAGPWCRQRKARVLTQHLCWASSSGKPRRGKALQSLSGSFKSHIHTHSEKPITFMSFAFHRHHQCFPQVSILHFTCTGQQPQALAPAAPFESSGCRCWLSPQSYGLASDKALSLI